MGAYDTALYAGAGDLPALIAFAQEITAARPPGASYYHPGDFVWQLYALDESGDVRIWRDDAGRMVACAIFEPPIDVQFALGPSVEGVRALTHEILDWAEARRAKVAAGAEIPLAYRSRGEDAISTSALESDSERIDTLVARGYTRHDQINFRTSRPLDDRLPAVVLPEGARFRAITDADADERAELHRDAWSVWGESKHTVERYRRLRAAPLYEPDLDVVLDVDGRMVSYCVCWRDDANRVGLFEPVGTRPSATRRGYGRLVMYEAFRRLRDKGMTTAIVGTSMVNRPAMALYTSVGFRPVEREFTYVKRVLG